MKNILFKIIFSLILIFTLTGCSDNNKFNLRKKEGYKISVRYESNGGTYLDREGITVVDMFNPDDYNKDSNGVTHIKLLEPTNPNRPSGGSEGIYITRTNYFLVGWYKNKTVRMINNKPVNENGEALIEKDGKYYLESNPDTPSEVAYDYSGYWDFNNDTIDYTSDMGEYELTLYAKWSLYFEFQYYYQDGSEWKYLGNTVFDYKTTNQEGSITSDKDTIWLPTWQDGSMNYTHKYQNNSTYSFPKVEGYTFKKAYLDKELTEEINGSYEHTGSINFETGEAINPIVNVYITLDEGEYYYISEASQLASNANLNGIYVIENDLDFTDVDWPTMFSLGTFNGKIYSKDDNVYKLSNISVTHSSDSAKIGGVFGKIYDKAKISNVEFENVTLDLAYVGRRNRNTSFGLIAGLIDDKTSIENVKLSGTIKIGAITLGDDYSINLVANGDNNDNINVTSTIHVVIYGTLQIDVYNYTVDPENVTIDPSGYITLVSVTGNKRAEETIVIQ